ncbi:MAG: hypothetical protein ACK481_01670 [Candidatus Melainabacteria bacterium]
MSGIKDTSNTVAIERFFSAKQAERSNTGGYKWNLKQNGVTGTIASDSNGRKLIDDFSKTTDDISGDGIIADGAELNSFITFAKKYDNFDNTTNPELYTYLQTQWSAKFPSAGTLDVALGKLFDATQLNSTVSTNDSAKSPESLFLKTLILELQGTDIDKRITELTPKTNSTQEEAAELTRLTALRSNASLNQLQKQAKLIIEKNKAEEEVSSFFTTKGADKTFTPAENNIKQIAIDNTGNLIDPPASSDTSPTKPEEQSKVDSQELDRATNYAEYEAKNSGKTGSVDTIAWLAGRMQTRLLEIRRRIDNPEVRAAVSAFTDQVKEVPKSMNTRRVSLSHLLGTNAKGEDLAALFDDSVDNKSGGTSPFRTILIENIFDNKNKVGVENTYDFLISLLQKHYPAEYAKGIGGKKFIEKLPENVTKEEIGKYLDGIKSVLGNSFRENREFIKKINEALGSDSLIKEASKNSSIWGILQNSAKSDLDISLAEGGTFASMFPAKLSKYAVNLAQSARVTVDKETDINKYIKSSVDKDNTAKVREEVAKFAGLENKEDLRQEGLKGALKMGRLEILQGGLISELNVQVGKNSSKNPNELTSADKLEAQIIVGKLILIEQSLSVRGDLITNKGKTDYFTDNAVKSFSDIKKVSSRVQGLLSEFKNQEEAYSDMLTKAADETLAPLQQALDGIFNFDVGYSPIRSYGYMKADLDISRALVSMTINNVITDEIAKKTAAENGARSAGDTSQSTDKSKEGQDAASILGMINSSIDKLVENSSKNQASMARGGEEIIQGLHKSLESSVSGVAKA